MDRDLFEGNEQLKEPGVWGQAPSFHRDAIAELLRLVARDPRFGEMSRQVLEDHRFQFSPGQDALSLYSLHPKPWEFLSEHKIKSMEKLLPSELHNPFREHARDRTRYYVSAASQASMFLLQLPQHLRISIRSIALHDTHASVSHPECHARALIRFAIENPKLKIVHRADLWGAVLTSLQSVRYEEYRSGLRRGLGLMRTMKAVDVTRTVGLWMMEALALKSAGMPPESFTLIFEGEAHLMQPIFDIVIEDAAWQEALQNWPGRHVIPSPPDHSGTGYMRYPCYFFEAFPDLMRDVLAGTGGLGKWAIDMGGKYVASTAQWYYDTAV
ncbi:uncharacterized protein J4E87_007561 [Alternaria ethzedia]|uniref:uncharacterized protein n=1 Tax=Alternaria ethzedia TaxID=181014 RepID=UPI0020C29B1B|nr:uncharacterized protein J4E87_007561 [Alternaria ethzedia]KAI4619311.1 hypothetical protein J4E87_007561 [Alternaria ethzedia]